MTKKYVTRAAVWRAPCDEEDGTEYRYVVADTPQVFNLTAYEPTEHVRDTGLIDSSGLAIFSVDEKQLGYLSFGDDGA